MNRTTWIALSSLALCLTAVPPAQATSVKCDKSPYDVDLVVVHANGMRTDLRAAKASLEKLRPLVDQKLGQQPYAISYAVAYNQKKGWLSTAFKVVRERVGMSESRAIRILSGLEVMPDSLRDELLQLAAERDLRGFEDDASLERHVLMYGEHLRGGRKVLVIAHSEGNMYANAAYRQLFETSVKTPGERSFGIVGIANPAPELAGSWRPPGCDKDLGCYTTLREDLVIGAVINLITDTAPANIFTQTPNPQDALRHGIDEIYLKNDEAREQILRHVAAFVDAFEPLEIMLNDSTFTAYLKWNTAADLDLHVYEHGTSEHVYPSFPESDGGGHLDVDDQDGYGPEHYYAECAALKGGGDFRFAVGYYAGDGPVTAELRLKIGGAVRTYTRVLQAPTREQSLTNPEGLVVLRAQKRLNPFDAKDQLIDDYEVEFTALDATH